jgi:hypothetical protein
MELINQIYSFNLPIVTAATLASATVAPASLPPISMQTNTDGSDIPRKLESDRDVIRCMTCGMVQ